MTTEQTETSNAGLTDRLRNSLALVQTRITNVEAQARAKWINLPVQLRQLPDQLRDSARRVVQAASSRVRASLDLPSSAEVQDLLARVEELDRRLRELQGESVAVEADPSKPAKRTSSARKKTNGAAKASDGKKASSAKKANGAAKKNRVNKIAERASKSKR